MRMFLINDEYICRIIERLINDTLVSRNELLSFSQGCYRIDSQSLSVSMRQIDNDLGIPLLLFYLIQ